MTSSPHSVREILEKLVCWHIPYNGVYSDEEINSALKELIKIMPASNRGSFHPVDHYRSRYKAGWNAYRAEVIKLLKGGL